MVDVMAHVKLDRISKSFKGHTALHDLSIEIADGQFFVLLDVLVERETPHVFHY